MRLPLDLAALLPPAGVALVLLGWAHGLRHLLAFGLAPLALVVVYRAYHDGAHHGAAPFEMARYLTHLLPFCALLAAFGVRELEALARRHAWPPTWRRAALLALLALALLAPRHPLWPGERARDARPYHLRPLDRDLQIEGRYLLELMARFPDCAFVARPLASEGLLMQRPGDPSTLTTALFGGPVGGCRCWRLATRRPG